MSEPDLSRLRSTLAAMGVTGEDPLTLAVETLLKQHDTIRGLQGMVEMLHAHVEEARERAIEMGEKD